MDLDHEWHGAYFGEVDVPLGIDMGSADYVCQVTPINDNILIGALVKIRNTDSLHLFVWSQGPQSATDVTISWTVGARL
ncbi:hypothetical protein [Bifidobacterium sp. ESL0790]|uniref:hypothetical protein n=1 Tax=Bifidobacterium sp. ESL0790 TaxID=2983233 RepID=UPI0023F7FC73|nr:hypothetical protein [Bifidobacterium sp. ESL0790]WEV72159.1 hypothetical protein OZY47_06880 [Bifidobacterium sp. ESL0790]